MSKCRARDCHEPSRKGGATTGRYSGLCDEHYQLERAKASEQGRARQVKPLRELTTNQRKRMAEAADARQLVAHLEVELRRLKDELGRARDTLDAIGTNQHELAETLEQLVRKGGRTR